MKRNKKIITFTLTLLLSLNVSFAFAQKENNAVQPGKTIMTDSSATAIDTTNAVAVDDNLLADGEESALDSTLVANADKGAYTQLKKKFVEGGAGFMSLVALALVLGLAICIERIIYLSMSEIDAKKFMADLEKELKDNGVEAAKELCRNTRGPVASICYRDCYAFVKRMMSLSEASLLMPQCRSVIWRRVAHGLHFSSLWLRL